ncbi:uncharacterized protein K452DRAFT_300646 [Aplosporella prunicola CBS 121167]|uniref:Mid2 domain-containing protein n=1 Tax=Aplosporella prunicola CBS 121167 TaxID=1176127 RepID=A0A6A6B4K7_9PEZI|nr:uncharacterized protein K452DRAFT_300646 [Aplosporella prunicola CBS 121167]KAF2139082.1 hypothetical protein K452DRAFT_300646 [Aplosporella prunicola CBS 121167]
MPSLSPMLLTAALLSVSFLVGTSLADVDPIFFYSNNYDVCSFNRVTITDTNNSPSNNYSLCAYQPDKKIIFNCPGDPICWTTGQTCNTKSVKCTTNINGQEYNWCCDEAQQCTKTTGQKNICWSGFQNPDKGLSGSERASRAEASHVAMNSAASESLSAYSRTASPSSSATTSASAAASASASTTASASTSAAASSSNTSSSTGGSSGLSTSAKAGIGVGVSLGVLGFAALGGGIFLWRRSRNRNRNRRQSGPDESEESKSEQQAAAAAAAAPAGSDADPSYYAPPPGYHKPDAPLSPMSPMTELQGQQRIELSGEERVELHGESRAELPGGGVTK